MLRFDSSGRSTDAIWGIVVESPVAITVNGIAWTVMLASPANLEDLAIGLLHTEQMIADSTDITSVEISEYLNELTVAVTIPSLATDRLQQRRRTLAGNSGCGLCGVESLAALHSARGSQQNPPVPISDQAIRNALAELPEHQALNALTHTAHAAAWCSQDGTIIAVREDVGRHNALDKLVGAIMRTGGVDEPGFVLMTSRCSYELVAKASTIGALALVSISAPTTMALQWSRELCVPVITIMRRGSEVYVVRYPEQPATEQSFANRGNEDAGC